MMLRNKIQGFDSILALAVVERRQMQRRSRPRERRNFSLTQSSSF